MSAKIALLSPESEVSEKVISLLNNVNLPIVSRMDDYSEIIRNTDLIIRSGASHALVAADFRTGIPYTQDGSRICSSLHAISNIFLIGLSDHPLSHTMMNYGIRNLDSMITFLVGWKS